MSDVSISLKKKEYNPSTDKVDGLIVFDKTTSNIFVGGEMFGSNIKDASWNSTTKTLIITDVEGHTHEMNFLDATSSDSPSSILSGLRDDVNTSKTTLSTLTGKSSDSIDGKIENRISGLDSTATIAVQNADGTVTLYSGLTETDGIVKENKSSVSLAKISTTGIASDISATYDEHNPETGEVTTVRMSVQEILDSFNNQFVTLSGKTFRYTVPTSAGTCPIGYRHYTSSTQSYSGTLNASETTLSNIYLCKTESYTGPYHQIVTVVNGSSYSFLDITSAGINLDGYIQAIQMNGTKVEASSGTTVANIGDVVNLIGGEQDITVGGNDEFVSVSTVQYLKEGVNQIDLVSKVKVIDINRTSDTVDGLASARDVKNYVKDNSTIFRTWTEADIKDI